MLMHDVFQYPWHMCFLYPFGLGDVRCGYHVAEYGVPAEIRVPMAAQCEFKQYFVRLTHYFAFGT